VVQEEILDLEQKVLIQLLKQLHQQVEVLVVNYLLMEVLVDLEVVEVNQHQQEDQVIHLQQVHHKEMMVELQEDLIHLQVVEVVVLEQLDKQELDQMLVE